MSKNDFRKEVKEQLLKKTPETITELYLQAKWELELKDLQIKELEREQIIEMQEHQNAMQVANDTIKRLEEENKKLIKGEYQKCCKYCSAFDEQVAITNDIDKELQELPKKICDEIREEIDELQYEFDKYPNITIEGILQEIQAKYEKE